MSWNLFFLIYINIVQHLEHPTTNQLHKLTDIEFGNKTVYLFTLSNVYFNVAYDYPVSGCNTSNPFESCEPPTHQYGSTFTSIYIIFQSLMKAFVQLVISHVNIKNTLYWIGLLNVLITYYLLPSQSKVTVKLFLQQFYSCLVCFT